MKNLIIVSALLIMSVVANAQKTINIWPGKAPGAETWDWHDQIDTTAWKNDPLAYNVSQPTLTYYPADQAIANGTSVIVCPGGSFSYLHVKTEGSDVAYWLNKKGVSVFVLRYRVAHSQTIYPVKEKNERAKDTALANRLMKAIIPMAIADGKQAITYIRAHAAEFGIDAHKIGMMGFSAGGTVATACAFGYTAENRIDFFAPMYAYVPPALPMEVLKDAPPAFIAAASDDELHLVPMSINLYNKWLAAGIPAELHIYSKGGHGFGMNVYHLPSDTWIERFGDWLGVQGLLKK